MGNKRLYLDKATTANFNVAQKEEGSGQDIVRLKLDLYIFNAEENLKSPCPKVVPQKQ